MVLVLVACMRKLDSLFVLGWETNREYFHCIAQDRRDPRLKSREELAFGGERISLTLRLIATFERVSDGFMFGQGAIHKTEELIGYAFFATSKTQKR